MFLFLAQVPDGEGTEGRRGTFLWAAEYGRAVRDIPWGRSRPGKLGWEIGPSTHPREGADRQHLILAERLDGRFGRDDDGERLTEGVEDLEDDPLLAPFGVRDAVDQHRHVARL